MTDLPTPIPSRRWTPTRRSLVIAGGAVAVLAAAGVPPVVGLLSPRVVTVDDLLRDRPFLIAHHGGSANWPEMSLHAYERAVALGVPALEMSLGRSSDGVWFGLHDATLDRTSGTTGFLAKHHTWDEIRHYRIRPPASAPRQPSRPYLRLTDFLSRFASTHVLFLDPKSQAPRHYPELLRILEGSVPNGAKHIVAKSPATALEWSELAAAAGYRRWGFYYARDLDADPGLLRRTQGAWDLLGLDVGAPTRQWSAMTALGRPVVAHVIGRRTEEQRALAEGAAGLMVGDLLKVSR